MHHERVNCFDEECYHISMLIRHPEKKPIEINTYQYSKEVFQTLVDILVYPSEYFRGRSMHKEAELRPFTRT